MMPPLLFLLPPFLLLLLPSFLRLPFGLELSFPLGLSLFLLSQLLTTIPFFLFPLPFLFPSAAELFI
jgi:hypothetical protein